MAFVQGMDLDKLEAFRNSFKAHPVILGLESQSVWEGHSVWNTTHIGPYTLAGQRIDRYTRHYTFSYGAWREIEEAIGFEGPTDQVEPVDMVLRAMGACLSNSIGPNALCNGISLEGMELIVRSGVDPIVLFEVKDPAQHAACIPNIICEVKVKGNLTEDQLKTVERFVEYSPAHGKVSHANNISSKVSRG